MKYHVMLSSGRHLEFYTKGCAELYASLHRAYIVEVEEPVVDSLEEEIAAVNWV
jgi:hypothetical protein